MKTDFKNGFRITITGSKTNCKYHPTIGQIYETADLVADGMCSYLALATYPECLNLLYGQERPGHRQKKINCIKSSCKTAATVYSSSLSLVKKAVLWMKLLIGFLIHRDIDAIDRNVIIEIVESGNSDCFPVGAKFNFNTGAVKTVCPAALRSIFPYLPFKGKENVKVNCPDHINTVTFEIKRIDSYKKSNEAMK